MTNLEIAKSVVKSLAGEIAYGMYFTRNTVGDTMWTVYDNGDLVIDVCYKYEYFEVFGLSDDEQLELLEFYDRLRVW